MTTGNLAIQTDNVGKMFRIFDSPRQRLLQAAWGSRRRLYREFWALREVSFSLERGQTLGIVGRNGSGKSTLLQLISGTLTASQGLIKVSGRVGALLELGSGFNPEFSGIENVYMNGSILGLKRDEIDARLDDILAFADIGEFIEQPVKTYSSGMAVRLAFAVQAHIDPDILIVDEALAVGDELFQRKCFNRLEKLKGNGTSVVLVTHSCPQIIQHCDQALLLHRGRTRLIGEPQRITTFYQQLANADDTTWDTVLPLDSDGTPKIPVDTAELNEKDLRPLTTVIYESNGVEIVDLSIETSDGTARNLIPFGEGFNLRFRYRASRSFLSLQFGCHIASTSGQRITGAAFPSLTGVGIAIQEGEDWEIVFSFGKGLMPGTYFIGGGLWESQDAGTFLHRVVDYRALKVLPVKANILIGLCDISADAAKLIRQKHGELEPKGPNQANEDGSG